MNTFSRYFHTIRYLRPIQIITRIKNQWIKSRINLKPQPLVRHHNNKFELPILKHAHILTKNKIVLLNQVQDITSPKIWFDGRLDKLWLYNLHYFDFLHSQFKQSQNDTHVYLITRWIDENPPTKGCGWESYTISLRIVNWIKWVLVGNHADNKMLHSMAVQTRYLAKNLEYHLLANHLLSNAKALIFAGMFFAGPEANMWLSKGLRLLNREMRRQTLVDGAHFELSPMYHSIILENLLDCINLFATYEKKPPTHWLSISNSMFYWLACLCHHDNDIAFFNDAALGVAPTLQELKEYQHRLALNINSPKLNGITHLPASGYCRISRNNMLLIADVAEVGASYQPGHAHADSLSFELSIHNQRLFVNSGTSTYAESYERTRQRSTQAHNTVIIDDTNSSDVWKSFRVAKRARIFDVSFHEDEQNIKISASHNGYYKIDKIIHTRTWQTYANKLVIRDEITGNNLHKIQIMFYIHPQMKVQQCDSYSVLFYNQINEYIAKFYGDYPLQLIDTSYHPEFNLTIPNKALMIVANESLPVIFNNIIEWN